MVLNAPSKAIIVEPHLLDHAIGSAPRLHDESGPQLIKRLMVGAVDSRKLECRVGSVNEFLYILGLGIVMARDVEKQGAAQSDIQDLKSSANGEKGELLAERFRQRFEFPGVSCRISSLNQRGIGHRLLQIALGNIRTASQK